MFFDNQTEKVTNFVKKNNISCVVCNYSPLRAHSDWIKNLKNNLPNDVHLTQVDGHNIVSFWHASKKKVAIIF